jgi:hypothetical protein
MFEEILTPTALEVVSQVAIQPNLLDYCIVPEGPALVSFLDEVDNEMERVEEFVIEDERIDNSIKLPMDQFVYVVESVLSLHAFLKYGCSLLVANPNGIANYK